MSNKFNWDALGVTASLACAIHCAILPLLLTSLPVFGINIIENISFEYFMITLAFMVGCYSLSHGFRKHHNNILPIIIFTAGFLFLFAKQIWHSYQLWFLIPAVLLIVGAHYFNYRLCKRGTINCHHADCNH